MDSDTLLQVIAVNSDGRMTYKKVHIWLANEEPIVEEPAPEEASPAVSKTNPTPKQDSNAGQVALAKENSAGTGSDNAQADPREQMEELLR